MSYKTTMLCYPQYCSNLVSTTNDGMDRRFGRRTVGVLEICPYNPAHRVEAGSRFQCHLIECRKDHLDVPEIICKFNHTHRVKEPEYQHHMYTCPDRHVVVRELVHIRNDRDMQFKSKLAQASEVITPVSDENWDDELLAEPVGLPNLATKGVRFINSDYLSGLKPAQKKKFRQSLIKGNGISFLTEGETNCERIANQPPPAAAAPRSRPLRVPSKEPGATNFYFAELEKLNAGRGIGRASNSRIAANIFGSNPSAPVLQTSAQFGLAGIGRGRAVIPSKMPMAVTVFEDAERNGTPSPTEGTEDAAARNKRKLEKRLKQIERLEERKNLGEELNADEFAKLSLKDDVVMKLEDCNGF